MTTALVRWCDTPKEIMRSLGLRTIQPLKWAIDYATGEDETVIMMREADGTAYRVPILFSDAVHVDDDALEAMFEGRWYYDYQRDQLRRIPRNSPVFINGPHLITKQLRPEWRRRIYTDRPSPFVLTAYTPIKGDN